MKKFKIIEEGRLSDSEMNEISGGRPCSTYDICDFEIKQQMPCDNYSTGGGSSTCRSYKSGNPGGGGGTECVVFGNPITNPPGGGGGGSSSCGGLLGVVPNFSNK